jgi:SAM-dependent methyltransferase
MDVQDINRAVWNQRVQKGRNRWTLPVSAAEVQAARQGKATIFLTPTRRVPADWLGELAGKDVLCLASGGGQQGPLLAAAGGHVVVFDLSDGQLAQDRYVAEREGLELETVQGDMRDLSAFADTSFDLIVHPIANCFIPDVRPVWREAYRVLRPGGSLLTGMVNPILYALLDNEDGVPTLHRTIPYSDLESLNKAERERHLADGGAIEFGHTLEELIGGQIEAGFIITGFYEDRFPGKSLDAFLPSLFATRAKRWRCIRYHQRPIGTLQR